MSWEYLQREAGREDCAVRVSPAPPPEHGDLLEHHGGTAAASAPPRTAGWASSLSPPWDRDGALEEPAMYQYNTTARLGKRRMIAGCGVLDPAHGPALEFAHGPELPPQSAGGGPSRASAGGAPAAPPDHPAARRSAAGAGGSARTYAGRHAARFAADGKPQKEDRVPGWEGSTPNHLGEARMMVAGMPSWFAPMADGWRPAPDRPAGDRPRVVSVRAQSAAPVASGLRGSIRRAGRARRSIAAELEQLRALSETLGSEPPPGPATDQQASPVFSVDEDEREYVESRIAGLENHAATLEWMVEDLKGRAAELKLEEDAQAEEDYNREQQQRRRRRLRRRQQKQAQIAAELQAEQEQGARGPAGHRTELQSLLQSMLRPRGARAGSERGSTGSSSAPTTIGATAPRERAWLSSDDSD